MSKALQSKPQTVAVEFTTAGLTPAMARKVGAIDAQTTADSIREQAAAVAAAGGSVMWEAAILTHYTVETAGLVGKGQSENGGWESQSDYADAIGYGKSYVTRLKRLGRAIVVHGIRRDSAAFTYLCSKADAASLREVTEGDDSKAYRDAVKAQMTRALETPEQRKARQHDLKATDTPATDDGTAGAGGDSGPSVGRVRTLGDVLALVGHIREALPGLTDEERDEAHQTLLDLVKNDRKRRSQTVPGEVVATA